MCVGNLDVTGTFLGQDGVALDDKGVAELVAGIVPEAGRGVAQQTAVAVVIDGVGDAEVVVHQRRHEVKVGGAVPVSGYGVTAWLVDDKGHANLVLGEVGVVAPVVLVVLVVFLGMVACDENQGVVIKPLLFDGCHQLAYHLIGLVGRVTVEVPEGGRVHVVVQLVELSVLPRRLETREQFFGQAIGMEQVEEDEAEERTKSIGAGRVGILRIGISDQLDINGILPGFLKEFISLVPTVDVKLSAHKAKILAMLTSEGELDVAFIPFTGDVSARFGLSSIEVNRACPRLYYSNLHPKARRPKLAPSDFHLCFSDFLRHYIRFS